MNFLKIFLVIAAASSILEAKELKVLMIGNSFSDSVGAYLPSIVNRSGHKLELTGVYIGGCSLAQHSKYLTGAEKDPSIHPYRITVWNSDEPGKFSRRKGNVRELLLKNKYDIISLQQGGSRAPFRETFHPHLEHLTGFIRRTQPEAEIVFQQTWAYRIDDTRFKPYPNPKFDFDQTGMYERVRDVYRELASIHNMRVIPVGGAVQQFRKNTPVKFKIPVKPLVYPDTPDNNADPVGITYWRKNKETGKVELRSDLVHLNSRGQYLQACVWFAFLYGEDAGKIAFVPEKISEKECILLRRCAQNALVEYQQIKK